MTITNYWTFKPTQKGQLHYFIIGLLLAPIGIGILLILFRFLLYKMIEYQIRGSKIIKYQYVINQSSEYDLTKLLDVRAHKLSFINFFVYYNVYLIFEDGIYLKLRLPEDHQLRENMLSFINSFLENY